MTSNRNNAGLANYRLLVSRIDDLATSICARYAAQITCRPGCSGCCRHLTLFPVEAAALVAALADLPAASRRLLCDRGEMPADGPCPLLQEDGRCLAYAARPIICRTHGLPLLTESDGVKNIDYCPENFQEITSLPGDAVMNLEILNRTLVAINAQFVTDTAVPVFRTQERFSMADIVRMACETGATRGREEMTLLDTILKANRKFVHPGAFPPLPKNPKKQFAIFTCMDTRLVDFLEPAMGIKRGDAKVIKNAGNTLVDPLHGGVIRSLVAAIFMLGVEEIFVIGHEDCGMSSVKPEELKQTMITRGISPEAINTHVPDLAQWLGAFSCPQENVSDVVAKIRSNPLIPADVPVHGLIFCPNDGHLDVIVNGYESNLFKS